MFNQDIQMLAFICCCAFNTKRDLGHQPPPNNSSKKQYLRWQGLYKPCILIHAHHDTDLNQTVP